MFFQFLKYMSVVFFFLTVFSIPQMVLSATQTTSWDYKKLLTLGNFETQRYPTPACSKTLFKNGKIATFSLHCTDDSTVLGNLTDFGQIPIS